ncbi:MAG: putative phosphohydrolase [Bacteroidetes bacterium]|nr:MAG: putative phosphohydrolase [Bacteroidota bacterium]
MRQGSILGFIIFLVILVMIDVYVFQGVRTMTRSMTSQRWRTVIHWSYWIISIGIFAWMGILALTFTPNNGPTQAFMRLIGVTILFLIPKLVFLFFLLGEDVFRLVRMAYAGIHNMVVSNDLPKLEYSVERRKFISQAAMAIAAVPFLGILHGLTLGKFNFTVRRETIHYPDLPEAFDGLKITQISDLHSGSFDTDGHRSELERAVRMINEQQSDIVLFTGDLVNNVATEILPWIDVFSKIKAPMGKFSVLGNHDYGDYVGWDSEAAKAANMQSLYGMHQKIGFDLLRNENRVIEKDGERFWLLGVENWGTGGFKKAGDLQKTLAGVPVDSFKILMSHDPSHWENEVQSHQTHIHLTLSGHTHGSQFGIEIPGIKWSPVKYRYPYWAGLYEAGKRYLYVNRGLGFLALPARVGIWPEITVITLKKGKATA